MLVALARIAEALIMIPGIFTSLAICSDYNKKSYRYRWIMKSLVIKNIKWKICEDFFPQWRRVWPSG